MFTSESLSSIFIWLVDLFGAVPTEDIIRGIVYDRACDLLPFLQRLAKEGNKMAQSYINLFYIVYIFHCEKHTMPKCNLNHEDCFFHPKLPKFNFLKGMNTESAEQGFNHINPFKFITRKIDLL